MSHPMQLCTLPKVQKVEAEPLGIAPQCKSIASVSGKENEEEHQFKVPKEPAWNISNVSTAAVNVLCSTQNSSEIELESSHQHDQVEVEGTEGEEEDSLDADISYLDAIISDIGFDNMDIEQDEASTSAIRPLTPPFITLSEQLTQKILVVPQPDSTRRVYSYIKSSKNISQFQCIKCRSLQTGPNKIVAKMPKAEVRNSDLLTELLREDGPSQRCDGLLSVDWVQFKHSSFVLTFEPLAATVGTPRVRPAELIQKLPKDLKFGGREFVLSGFTVHCITTAQLISHCVPFMGTSGGILTDLSGFFPWQTGFYSAKRLV